MHHCLLNYIYFYTKSPIVPSFQDPILSFIRRSCVLPVSITVLFFESYTLKILQVCLFPSSPLPGVREMLSLAYILSSLALTHTGYPDRSFPFQALFSAECSEEPPSNLLLSEYS